MLLKGKHYQLLIT